MLSGGLRWLLLCLPDKGGLKVTATLSLLSGDFYRAGQELRRVLE